MSRLSGVEVKEAGRKKNPSQTDKTKEKVAKDKKKKDQEQSLKKIKGLKEQLKDADDGTKSKQLAALLKQLRDWWAEGQQDAFFEASKLCLKTREKLEESQSLDSCKKGTFQVLQEILRSCGGPQALQDSDLLPKLQKVALKRLQMSALADSLGGPGLGARGRGRGLARRAALFASSWAMAPELLARPSGAADPRVQGFKPDPWQSTLLDVADAGHSALVQAPHGSWEDVYRLLHHGEGTEDQR